MRMRQYLKAFAVVCMFLPSTVSHAAGKVGASGNPLPRFVSIAATKAYMRTGPGRQYPIDWVFSRKTLPLEVIDENGPWRKVKDHEGAEGWMLVSLLSGKRTGMVKGGTHPLFTAKNKLAPASIIADEGVVGKLIECEKNWCVLEIKGTKGWITKKNLWGVYNHEVFD